MHGTFIWHELMTRDAEAAKRFYGDVVGWTATKSDTPGIDYHTFQNPGQAMGAAGLFVLGPDMTGMPAGWFVYIGADDVDATADRAVELGAVIHKAGTDIPGIGRFAMLADPHGAMFYLFKPIMPEGPMPDMPAPGSNGTAAWHELMAGDDREAIAFYGKLFGWEEAEVMDMGDMGAYRILSHHGNQAVGVMTRMPTMPVPYWNSYFAVDAIDAAATRVKAGGGQVINGPMEVPGGGWALNGIDPEGAFFSLFSMQK